MRRLFLSLALVAMLAPAVRAQTYPDRPIRILVPLAAGSAVDIVARLVADKMGEQLGQRTFVEAMPGAAGLIGMRTGARSAPDGYTVIAPNDSVLTMLPNMKADAGYDPFTDFIPVTQLVGIPLGLIANPAFPAKDAADLIRMAKEKPGAITYASGGPGSPQHVGMELFMRAAGITMTHVPYRGVTPAVQDVVGGQVPIMLTAMSAVPALLPDKRVRLLAATTDKRLPQFPDTPTLAETLPGFAFSAWCAFLLPAKTPPDIVGKLNAATHAALNDPAVSKRLTELGFIVAPTTPDQLAAYMKQEYTRTGNLIKEANIKSE
jgi:tripartite-type tricarboxylate transporter receptor subunit TctC